MRPRDQSDRGDENRREGVWRNPFMAYHSFESGRAEKRSLTFR